VTCPPLTALEQYAASPDADEPGVREHLASCPGCREQVTEIRKNNQLLGELSDLDRPPSQQPGLPRIPGYELVGPLGRGKQGSVYRATQVSTRRPVAIKILLGGEFVGARRQARFEREIELAASLRHPNIVTVFESSQTPDGRSFYAMELVEGLPLDRFIARADFPSSNSRQQIAGLFAKICAAVEYAHRRGIIHRDLKPANVLVDSSGEPRIVDFGLAKAIEGGVSMESALVTQTGEFAGTFVYASPEQTSGIPDLIDTRTDVYALGVMLYESITGKLPYKTLAPLESLLREINHVEPSPPSAVRPEIDQDLDTIVLKCLEKTPERRYESAGELARDLERYVRGEEIYARRDSTWYRIRKAVVRHRVPVSLATAALLTLLGFAVAMTLAYRTATRAEAVAEQRAFELADLLAVSNIERGRALAQSDDIPQAEETLWREWLAERARDGERWEKKVSPAHSALMEMYARHPCVRTFRVPDLIGAGITSDAKSVLSLARNPDRLAEYDAQSGQLVREVALARAPANFTISPDGSRAAVISKEGELDLVDLDTGEIRPAPGVPATLPVRALSTDGKLLVYVSAAEPGVVQVYDCVELRPLARVSASPGAILDVAISPDLRRLAAVSSEGHVHLWTLGPEPTAQRVLHRSEAMLKRVGFSDDGHWLWTISDSAGIRLFDLRPENAGAERTIFDTTPGQKSSVTISRDGKRLAIGGALLIGVWSMEEQRWQHVLAGHSERVQPPAFTEDGRELVSVSVNEQAVRRWALDTPWQRRVVSHDDSVLAAAFSGDGGQVVTGSSDRSVRLWMRGAKDIPSHVRLNSAVQSVALLPDGTIVAGTDDGFIRAWSGDFAHPARSWRASETGVYSIAVSLDGSKMMSTSSDPAVRLWDAKTGSTLREWSTREPMTTCRISPDGCWAAAAGRRSYTIRLWSTKGEDERLLKGHDGPIRSILFTGDGTRLITCSDDRTIRVWDTASGETVRIIKAHGQAVWGLSLAEDRRLLASCGDDGFVKLWDLDRARCLLQLNYGGPVFGVRLSPDGHTLSAWGTAKVLTEWDLCMLSEVISGNEAYWRQRLAAARP
jgi:WD40 repeat protein